MSRCTRSVSSPLGPFTVTRSGSIETVTPAGTVMGCLPIRDMACSTGLPDLRHHFAADALAAGLVPGHDPLGCRHDRGAHATLDAGDVGMVDVGALARARDSLQAADHRLARLGVLERDRQGLARPALGRV